MPVRIPSLLRRTLESGDSMINLQGQRVALALGGGGARGSAHIGAIRALQERGADLVAISGTSMGAVIGGVHAAGQLDPYAEWLSGLTYRDVLRLLDPALRSPGMIGAEKVMARIRDLIGDIRIEQLPIPYTAVATELMLGKEVWFQTGPLELAMRASIAVPSVITPLVHEGRVLVDGGLVNLVPVTPLAAVKADLIIAVSVGGLPTTPISLSASPTGAEAELEGVRSEAVRARDQDIVSRVRARLGWERPDAPDPTPELARNGEPVRTLDVMELSIQAMQRMITRFQMANFPADVLIELPVDACGTLEFHRSKEMIQLGYERTVAVLDG